RGEAQQRLFQLLEQQAEDALRGTRALRPAVLVEHVDQAALGVLLHLDAEVLGLGLGIVRAEQPREEAAVAVLLAHLRLRIAVAHEVQALLPVAVLDGEADAVERQADAPPGPVERLVDLQQLIAVAALLELRARLQRRPAARGELLRLFLLRAEPHHHAAQELGFEARVGLARLPRRLARRSRPLARRGGDLPQAAVAAIDRGD